MSFKNLYIEENLFRLQRFVTIVYILRNAATCIHKFFVKFISLASVEHINQNRGQLSFVLYKTMKLDLISVLLSFWPTLRMASGYGSSC